MQCPRRVARHPLAPELIDQPVDRNYLVRVEEQIREYRPALWSAQFKLPLAVPDLE